MELISWLATLVVLISFTLDGKKLRWVNFIGAGLWLIWGIGVEELAVVVLNCVIMAIHLYKLSIEKRKNLFATEIKKRLGKIF